MRFVRGLGKFIDWLGMRVLLLLVLGLVGYAVLQPLIWSEVLHRKLPAVSLDLGSLVGIVVTIMSLLLAVFGVVAYQLVERRTETRLEERARNVQAELVDNLGMKAVLANARIFINIGYQAFLSYEDMWKKANYTDVYIKSDPDVRAFLDSAIENAGKAPRQVLLVPPRLHASSEYQNLLRISTSNWVYFLATRASKKDEENVLELAAELDRPGTGNRQLETIAWAYLRYSEPGQALWNKGLAKLAQARRDAPPQPGSPDTRQQRYEHVFAWQKKPVRDAIAAALAGQGPPSPAAA